APAAAPRRSCRRRAITTPAATAPWSPRGSDCLSHPGQTLRQKKKARARVRGPRLGPSWLTSGWPQEGSAVLGLGPGPAADARQGGLALGLVLRRHGPELEPTVLVLALDVDVDLVLALEVAAEELLGQRVLDHVLDGAAERPGTVVGVVPLGDHGS